MGSEVIPSTVLFIGQAAILVIMPIALFAVGARAINGIQDARLVWTPYIEILALFVGVTAGLVILSENIEPGILGPSEVFRQGGPWDLKIGEFLAAVANPFAYDISSILPLPFSGRLPSATGFVVFLLSGVAIYAPIIVFRSRRAIANGVRNAFIVISSAYLTIYGFGYFLWLTNKLNFWMFLLLMVLIHQRRRSARIYLKLN